jgi:DNA end-binding protein Ku
MEKSGKAAIARFVFRNKEHLGAIRAGDNVLTLTTMRFADEVVPAAELDDALPQKQGKVAKKEQEMAEKLIDSLSTEFDPASYRDEYREQLLELIESKAEGKEIVAPETEEPEPTKAPDLMAALEESISAVKGRKESDEDGGGAKTKSSSASSSPQKRKSAPKASKSKSKAKSKSKSSGRAKAKSK